MIARATGGAILPCVVAVVDLHRAQGRERSVHVRDGAVLHVLVDADTLVVAAEDEFDEAA